ncbi:PTS sugar transporter subunit IIA [Edwardsiella tarda]|uniref:PTS sugar transporter subunit IIA n=1 Tax=Edwardsiella tarda TaxID=636 RepID=UPI002670A04A|nr:PTS sugar transporter subunit IIA [Edwardsiella tarda]WKS80586.1 PTS sugar transporter subunit IIA [Edwardsiella tarda]
MLGIVFAGHSGFGSGMMKALTQLLGARPIQCIGVEFSDGVSSNMLSRMMCDALHQVDSGDGVVIIADILGAPPFRAAALMCHKHPHCEVVVGVSLAALAEQWPQRGIGDAVAFREALLTQTRNYVTSLWHEQSRQAALFMPPES